jgi:hypothetical protein
MALTSSAMIAILPEQALYASTSSWCGSVSTMSSSDCCLRGRRGSGRLPLSRSNGWRASAGGGLSAGTTAPIPLIGISSHVSG